MSQTDFDITPYHPKVVILSGAGLSAESGIDTFRKQGGVWDKYRLEDVATPEAFKQTPEKVHEFYNFRRQQLQDTKVKPNKAHKALAKLSQERGDSCMHVTQNVYNLLEQAGAKNIIHMHGELLKIRCESCSSVQSWNKDVFTTTKCNKCGVVGKLRPHIVWFGEIPFGLETIYTALAHCLVFAAIGTSGAVYPASGFIQEARKGVCERTVEINPERTEITGFFKEHMTGKATESVPDFVDEILQNANYRA